jgi:predicted MPP superfamily phosphohydrolase
MHLADREILAALEARLGRTHARQRLGIETEHEARVFGNGLNFFHPENWYGLPSIIGGSLTLVGMRGRAHRNTTRIAVRTNEVALAHLPPAFHGFTLLQISDLHVDMNDRVAGDIAEVVRGLDYDLCVLTGDFRASTAGPIEPTLDGMRRIRTVLKETILGVLGNHDSVRMLPALEAMGMRLLMNESIAIERDGATIHVAGVDDAHYYRVDNIDKAASAIDADGVSILLSHTPEIYRQAAHAGFDLMLSGHTHGGQICLPGGVPVFLDAKLPRRYGRGAWRHQGMQGYTSAGAGTSILDARLNCPPEVTLHRLVRGTPSAAPQGSDPPRTAT